MNCLRRLYIMIDITLSQQERPVLATADGHIGLLLLGLLLFLFRVLAVLLPMPVDVAVCGTALCV
jgi:hypothetical protein